MKEQNFNNHVKIPIYHLIGLPFVIIVFIGTIFNFVLSIAQGQDTLIAVILLGGAFGSAATFFLIRFYALRSQDRIIRTEENLRHYILTGRLLDPRLTVDQIIALRFASDEEFPALCENAIKENFDRKEIKKVIENWRGDHVRV